MLRYFIMAAFSLPFILLNTLISWDNNIVILVIFKTVIPFFLTGLVIFAFSHYVCEYFGLVHTKDYMSKNIKSEGE